MFSKFKALGSGFWRVWRHTFAERSKFGDRTRLKHGAQKEVCSPKSWHLERSYRGNAYQAVLQGVPVMGVQVLRQKRLVLLHEKGSGEPQK